MKDLEITRLCAEAMGIQIHLIAEPEFHVSNSPYYEIPTLCEGRNPIYDPLHDDAQAMALLKRFFGPCLDSITAHWHNSNDATFNLNRAICECVTLAGKE